ncbi:hypothetical protein EHQ12_04090 [Leptospira gomenensis]|uniref:GNAT family N-acetyltransferase n=1 Tax=Leptospira gomenensis TaxID=2484974 RepID=A0A5F1YH78_9LEPT|nr:hypothetical protein [Leptospira gomenensis]TGK36222.1 hypothetical protein EHQ17_04630 [Leptospira gomenensis]TGK42800.1 hypothetical protein EHQ07_13870 [Leptospira gomenensis]TGK42979.1 hypothetical protein EHQ12_04090 [Leptospira gomenensis]TGK54981.1 hypothetical protein EHQ13_18345 [Leptospira gomenensis]
MDVSIMDCKSMSEELLHRIKSFVSSVYSDAGYSETPWKNQNYDPWSTWFWVEVRGELLAAMRIVEKTPDNIIPLEKAVIYGIKNPFLHYAVLEENVADWNAVAFKSSREGVLAAKKTFRTVAKFCADKGYYIVYGMYNPELSGIENLYLREGAEISDRYPAYCYFPGFNLKGELSKFNVIELRKDSLQKIASKL